ncbi:hypothetical protein DFJ74DRAFT_768446 [Hyaloraphidium curvatum]|nr:hypothetical protein DFJ74DRAFT_768446 [Hyaloraphidium curvatum]
MLRAPLLLLALVAGVASAAAAPRASVLFARSCAECADEFFCEFAHPGAPPDRPIACVSHADRRTLYRRYAAVDCLADPGLAGRRFEITQPDLLASCLTVAGSAPPYRFELHVDKSCAEVSGLPPDITYAVPASGGTPGSCFDMSFLSRSADYYPPDNYGARFSEGCESFNVFLNNSACSGGPGTRFDVPSSIDCLATTALAGKMFGAEVIDGEGFCIVVTGAAPPYGADFYNDLCTDYRGGVNQTSPIPLGFPTSGGTPGTCFEVSNGAAVLIVSARFVTTCDRIDAFNEPSCGGLNERILPA